MSFPCSGNYFTAPNNRPRLPDDHFDNSIEERGRGDCNWRGDDRDVVVEEDLSWRAPTAGHSSSSFLPNFSSSLYNHTHSAPSPHFQQPPHVFQDCSIFSEEDDDDDDDFGPGFQSHHNKNCQAGHEDDKRSCCNNNKPQQKSPNFPFKIDFLHDIRLMIHQIIYYFLEGFRSFVRDKILEFQETQTYTNSAWKGLATCLFGGGGARGNGRMTRRVVDYASVSRIALESRLILLVIQVIVTNLSFIPKHQNDGFKADPEKGYGTVLDNLIFAVFGGGSNWDGQYFMQIAVNGYTHESVLAFFPLFPMLLYVLAKPIHLFLWWGVSLSSIVLIVGWFLNTVLFVKTAQALYKITECFETKYGHMLTSTAVIIFCFNPASVFFSSLYTESLFAFLTANVILSLTERNTFKALCWASLSTLCRSNGLLNFGFVMFYWIQEDDEKRIPCVYDVIIRPLKTISGKVPRVIPFLVPFLLFQKYAVMKFCCEDQIDAPEYCKFYMLPYAYVQDKYWNVGFLRYFEVKQIPNFVLAFPVLYFVLTESWKRFRFEALEIVYGYTWQNAFSFFHTGFGIFLAFFCFLNIHVQVSTRLILAAFPYLYVYLAETCCLDIYQIRSYESEWPATAFCIHCWCLTYFLIGGVLFPLGYPWT